MGLNEFAGYVTVAGAALMTGWIAARTGLRPEPFYPGLLFAALGLGLSLALVRDTLAHVAMETTLRPRSYDYAVARDVFLRTRGQIGIFRPQARLAS